MKKDRIIIPKVLFIFLIILAIVYVVNISVTFNLLSPLNEKIEDTRPAKIDLLLITKYGCSECYDTANLINYIKSQTSVMQERALTDLEQEAKQLISKYRISTLPALIISGEVNKVSVASLWQSIGGESVDSIILVNQLPPYYNIASGKVEGLVEITYLTDSSCVSCYDVNTHKQILTQNFGVKLVKELTYDATDSSGKSLIDKYNITKLPTILLSPEASVYPALNQIWSQVGTKEKDGQYVFRATEQMGTYKDTSTGKIITP